MTHGPRPSSVGMLGMRGLGIVGVIREGMVESLLPDHSWEQVLGYPPKHVEVIAMDSNDMPGLGIIVFEYIIAPDRALNLGDLVPFLLCDERHGTSPYSRLGGVSVHGRASRNPATLHL